MVSCYRYRYVLYRCLLLTFATRSAMYWGNLGFVYLGATMRTAFLLALGFAETGRKLKR